MRDSKKFIENPLNAKFVLDIPFLWFGDLHSPESVRHHGGANPALPSAQLGPRGGRMERIQQALPGVSCHHICVPARGPASVACFR